MSAPEDPNTGSPPLTPYTDPATEARLVALVLGEASDFERAELESLLASDAALRSAHEQLVQIHGLVTASETLEANKNDSGAWKLSGERRAAVLEKISAPAVREGPAMATPAKRHWNRWPWMGAAAAAAVAILCFALPVFDSTMYKSAAGAAAQETTPYEFKARIDHLATPSKDPAASGPTDWAGTLSFEESAEGKDDLALATKLPESAPTKVPGEDRLFAGGGSATVVGGQVQQPSTFYDHEHDADQIAQATGGMPGLVAGGDKWRSGFQVGTAQTPAETSFGLATDDPFAQAGEVSLGYAATEHFAEIPLEENTKWYDNAGESSDGFASGLPFTTTMDVEFGFDSKPTVPDASHKDAGIAAGPITNYLTDPSVTASWDVNGDAQPGAIDRFYRQTSPPDVAEAEARHDRISGAKRGVEREELDVEPLERFGTDAGGEIPKREIARRLSRVKEAEGDVEAGRLLWDERDFAGARAKFQTAIDKIPDAPLVEEQRRSAVQQFADSTVLLADQKAREGARDEARELLEGVLGEDIDPGNKGAQQMLARLDDAEFYNAAETPKHVENVAEVERLGKVARGYYELGDYDEAEKHFDDMLRIDPYNQAARQGRVELESARSEYADAARDHTRALLLRKVDEEWEAPVPVPEPTVGNRETAKAEVATVGDELAWAIRTDEEVPADRYRIDLQNYADIEPGFTELIEAETDEQLDRLEARISQQHEELEKARVEMLDTMEQYNIVDLSLGAPAWLKGNQPTTGISTIVMDAKSRELNAEVSVRDLRTTLGALEAVEGKDAIEAAIDLGIQNPTLSARYPEYKNLELQRQSLFDSGLTEKHPKVVAVEKQLGQIEGFLEDSIEVAKNALGTQLEMAEQTLANADRPEGETEAAGLAERRKNTEYIEKKKAYQLQKEALNSMQAELAVAKIDARGSRKPQAAPIHQQLRETIIPSIKFDEATVEESLQYLRAKSEQHDPTGKGGVSIVTPPNDSTLSTASVTLNLTNVPLADAIQYVADAAGYEVSTNRSIVVLRPKAKRLHTAEAALDLEVATSAEPFSTFSLNVSDVSFKLAKTALLENSAWPDADKIRPEEFVNAFDYADPPPAGDEAVAHATEQCVHPFLPGRNLLRVSMSTAATGRAASTPLRLTVLLDKSGSMERADREASVTMAMRALAAQLKEGDEITVIGFARTPRLIVDRLPGKDAGALAKLVADAPSEGGTNLEEALRIAREKAGAQFVEGAENRIVLLTDGAANLGELLPKSLQAQVVALRDRGIALDACGIGFEGLDDEKLEALTRKGDGRYYAIDRPEDADESFVRQLAGALRPAAKNVKVQVKFNPARVASYRLSGFEKHRLNKEDFRNDQVDAAELAAAESGNAVYQIEVDPAGQGDVGDVFVRFRDLKTGAMVERQWPIPYQPSTPALAGSTTSMQTAALASIFAEKLKGGPLGELVDLDELTPVTTALRGANTKTDTLIDMIDRARGLE